MITVSALMPTCNRRAFIPRTIRCFQAQRYPADWIVELIILDDSDIDPIKDLLPDDLRIKYFHQQGPLNHGSKMNLVCERAQGDYFLVWDDDDVYSQERLAKQIQPLIDNPQLQLTGTSTFYYYKLNPNQAWRYQSPKVVSWLGAIAFRKSAWMQYKFDNIPAGSDYNLQRRLSTEAKLDLADPTLIVACIHQNNACAKQTGSREYQPVSWETIQQLVGYDL